MICGQWRQLHLYWSMNAWYFYIRWTISEIDAARNIGNSEKNNPRYASLNAPTNESQLYSFLGSCIVYRRFVPNFPRIATRVTAKMKKSKTEYIILTTEELVVVDLLKQRLTTPPVIVLPRRDGKLVIDTDEWDRQLRCVLQQEKPDKSLWPIGYRSWTLNDAER